MVRARVPVKLGQVRRIGLCFIVAMIAGAFLPANATEWQGKEVTRDGERHIKNPGEPIEDKRIYETTEKWRRGGEEDDVVFGKIEEIAVSGSGESYLLDSQINTVHIMAPDGAYVGSIGREGEGPGEFRSPCAVIVLPDGTLCVLQSAPARAVLITVEGDAAGDHPLPKGQDGSPFYLGGGAIGDGALVLCASEFIQAETSFSFETSFIKVDVAGAVTATYWSLLRTADIANVELDEKADDDPRWTVGADGWLYLSDQWDAYAISVFNGGGSLEHIIDRDYEPRKRSDREIEIARKGMLSPNTKMSSTSRGVLRLFARDEELWVLSSRGAYDSADNTIAAFDVFDRKGRFLRQVDLLGDCRRHKDVFSIVGDYAFIITGAGVMPDDDTDGSLDDDDEVEPMQVICLEIAKAGEELQ